MHAREKLEPNSCHPTQHSYLMYFASILRESTQPHKISLLQARTRFHNFSEQQNKSSSTQKIEEKTPLIINILRLHGNFQREKQEIKKNHDVECHMEFHLSPKSEPLKKEINQKTATKITIC
ncbi:hypothetical protein SAY87_022112 [Trapa incisa]|uniref:Uncharacterized protein n=1 Tax=Trapa incisa TaxID=236973 RepID=A0AAN7JUK8_9MYRT|nr:hypothetical protein SAY87_022112 [Trapa incisa]